MLACPASFGRPLKRSQASMRTLKVLLCLAVGYVLGLATWEVGVASGLRTQIVEMRHELTERHSAELAAAALSCAARSQRYFTALGYSESQAQDNAFTSFRNHYSRRLGRCLMTIESTSYKISKPVTTKTLFDTDEQRLSEIMLG